MTEKFRDICLLISHVARCEDTVLLNARHPDVLLKTIKIYKYRQNTAKFIILYHFWTTCFDSLESSSGPLVN